MSLCVALLLLGQVGNGAEPPASSFNPAPTTAPSATFSPAPLTVDSSSEGPPSEGSAHEAPPNDSFRGVRAPHAGEGSPASQTRLPPRSSRGRMAASPAAPPATLRAPVAAEPVTNLEPQVHAAPASGNSGTGSSQALQVAATMMEEILVLGEPSQHNARPVRLVEALSRLSDPGLQSIAIRSYWELAQSIANARYAGDKVRLLSELPAPGSDDERAVLEEARASADAEEAAMQDAVLAAQYGLLRVTGLPIEDTLPWPADAPLVSSYRTQFETIFANRVAPLPVRQIHHRLPGKLWVIEKRVSAVAAAETAMDAMLESYKGSHASLGQVLLAMERLDYSRQAFLAAIVDYNQQIAEYALAVVGSAVGPETLVTTLIKSVPGNGALVTIPPREVRQAAAASRAQ